jgi:uncharacterized repeat protein (TIGR03803 family)
MRRNVIMAGLGLAWGAAFAGDAAQAATFTVLATVPNGPAIGAYKFGKLYGTTGSGGASGDGTLFSVMVASHSYKLLHSFISATDGATPNGGLDVDASSNIFGTAILDGPHGSGTLWEFSTAKGTMTTLHAFGAAGDGDTPLEGPVRDSAGALFGTTAGGDVNSNGGLWGISSTGTYGTLYDFLSGADGHCPYSGPARASGGTLYGTTIGNGTGGNPTGSIWEYTTSGKLETLYVFQDGIDGEWPYYAPTVDRAANLYGTTYVQKGTNFAGAIWLLSAHKVFSVLHDLNAATDGSGPNGPLMLDTDGNLYGTTGDGGPGGSGTVFEITPAGKFTVLHAFTNGTDGRTPTGMLVHDGNGVIYGGTASGQIFSITP